MVSVKAQFEGKQQHQLEGADYTVAMSEVLEANETQLALQGAVTESHRDKNPTDKSETP